MPPSQNKDIKLFKRLISEARPYWPHIIGIFILGLTSTPLVLLNPVPLKIAVDSVVGSDPLPGFLDVFVPDWATSSNTRVLAFAAGLQITVVLLAQVHELFRYVLRTRAGEGIVLEFRTKTFQHIQRLSLLFHDTRGTADSLYRIQQDAPAIREIMVTSTISVFSSTVMLVVTMIIILSIDWQLALVAAIVMPILFVLARFYSTQMRPQYREARRL